MHIFEKCPAGSTFVNINSNKTLFYPFMVSINKCGGSCNTIDDPYAQLRFPNKVNDIYVKVFCLMSGINETIFLVHHQSCGCKCKLNESVYIQRKNGIIVNVDV